MFTTITHITMKAMRMPMAMAVAMRGLWQPQLNSAMTQNSSYRNEAAYIAYLPVRAKSPQHYCQHSFVCQQQHSYNNNNNKYRNNCCCCWRWTWLSVGSMCMTQPKGLCCRHSPSPPPLAALLWGRKYSNWTSRARWTQPETEGNVGRWARWCFVFQIFNWTSFTWGPREFPANPQPDPKMGNSWGLLKFPLATRKCDSSTKSIYWIRISLATEFHPFREGIGQ